MESHNKQRRNSRKSDKQAEDNQDVKLKNSKSIGTNKKATDTNIKEERKSRSRSLPRDTKDFVKKNKECVSKSPDISTKENKNQI